MLVQATVLPVAWTSMAYEQTRQQTERQAIGRTARRKPPILHRRPVAPEGGDMTIEGGIAAARLRHFGEVNFEDLRGLMHRAQHVQALDVPAAFPDRVDR